MAKTIFKAGDYGTWLAGSRLKALPCDLSAGPVPLIEPGRLHEIHAAPEDQAAAIAFALSVGDLAAPVVHLRADGARRFATIPFGEGLAGLGLAPERLLLVETADERDLLRAGLEAARTADVQLVLLDVAGAFPGYDLTASRRLALAAEAAGNRVIVLRSQAEPRTSAAQTRWDIASAPSVALEAQAPGVPALDIHLLRWRAGPSGQRWRLQWDSTARNFRSIDREFTGSSETTDAPASDNQRAALSGAVVPLSSMRTGALPAPGPHRVDIARSA